MYMGHWKQIEPGQRSITNSHRQTSDRNWVHVYSKEFLADFCITT